MPVTTRIPIRRLSQAEFGDISYRVIGHVFAIHKEFGRLFDEGVYKRELANRLPGVLLEEPIDISYGAFRKQLFLDVLVDGGAVYEFKAIESLTDAHCAQALQYLMVCDLGHGKLINMRPESVEHEFVNTNWRRDDRCGFEVDDSRWSPSFTGSSDFRDYMIGLLRDLGTGLTIPLYEAAAMASPADVRVAKDDRTLGKDRVKLLAPDTALKITAFDVLPKLFEVHARRWLTYVDLRALAWLNIGMKKVTFTLHRKNEKQKD